MNKFLKLNSATFNALNTSIRSSVIYTKTGDLGTSSTYTGDRRLKNDPIFRALGATDELSSHIGLARCYCALQCPDLDERLQIIQCLLQDVGSAIATPKSSAKERHLHKTEFGKQGVLSLEGWIDEYMALAPPLKMFILPSGGEGSCHLHIARSVCRRAEREVIPLVKAGEIELEPSIYLNRLSDFLFSAARYCAHKEGISEAVYKRATGEVFLHPTRVPQKQD